MVNLSIYHIKLLRILKYNMLLNYYRVLLCSFTSEFTSKYLYSVTILCVAEYKSK